MKKYFLSLLLLAFLSNIFAQTATTDQTIRIHILYKGGFGYKLKTTLNPDHPIALEAQSYTLLETNQTELTLLREKEPFTTLHFEFGKEYYFRFSIPEPLGKWNERG